MPVPEAWFKTVPEYSNPIDLEDQHCREFLSRKPVSVLNVHGELETACRAQTRNVSKLAGARADRPLKAECVVKGVARIWSAS